MFILYFGQTTPFSQFFRRLRLTAPLKRQSLHIGQFLQDLYPYLCLTGKEEREAGVVAAGSGSEWRWTPAESLQAAMGNVELDLLAGKRAARGSRTY